MGRKVKVPQPQTPWDDWRPDPTPAREPWYQEVSMWLLLPLLLLLTFLTRAILTLDDKRRSIGWLSVIALALLFAARPVFASTVDLPLLHWNIVWLGNDSNINSDPDPIIVRGYDGTMKSLMWEWDLTNFPSDANVSDAYIYYTQPDIALDMWIACSGAYNTNVSWSTITWAGANGHLGGYSPFQMYNPTDYGWSGGSNKKDIILHNCYYAESNDNVNEKSIDPDSMFLRVTYTAPTPTPTPSPTPTPTPTPIPNYSGEDATNSAQMIQAAGDTTAPVFAWFYTTPVTGHDYTRTVDVWLLNNTNTCINFYHSNWFGINSGGSPHCNNSGSPPPVRPDPGQLVQIEHDAPFFDSPVPFVFTYTLDGSSEVATPASFIDGVQMTWPGGEGSASAALSGEVPLTCGSINLSIIKIPDFYCMLQQWIYAVVHPNPALVTDKIAGVQALLNAKAPACYFTAVATGVSNLTTTATASPSLNVPIAITYAGQSFNMNIFANTASIAGVSQLKDDYIFPGVRLIVWGLFITFLVFTVRDLFKA